jgi:hypothetical protein
MAPAIVAYGVLVIAGACANTNTEPIPPTAIGPGTTSVSVDPMSFLGSVSCSNAPGGIGSYVATITDVTDPNNRFTLPSSPPTPCSQSVYFQNVNVGDLYIAEVDGYTQTADQLVPFCGALPKGKPQPCTHDAECLPAFGCQGACRVTKFGDFDLACFARCETGDAGITDAGSTIPPCAYDCLGTFESDHDAGTFGSCLADKCQVDGGADIGTCLAANNDCLSTEFAALQTNCDAQQQADAGADGVVHGALKQCTCTYLPTEGSRHMFLAKTPLATQPVPPVASANCGYDGACQSNLDCSAPDACGVGGVCHPQAQAYTNVSITRCNPLDLDGGAGTTAIEILPLNSVQGPSTAMPCVVGTIDGGMAGISSLEVVPCASNPSVLPAATRKCDMKPPPVVTYDQGVVTDGGTYYFTLNAYESGSTTPALTASCNATPTAGQTVYAMCDPLLLPTGPSDAGTDAGTASACP